MAALLHRVPALVVATHRRRLTAPLPLSTSVGGVGPSVAMVAPLCWREGSPTDRLALANRATMALMLPHPRP